MTVYSLGSTPLEHLSAMPTTIVRACVTQGDSWLEETKFDLTQ